MWTKLFLVLKNTLAACTGLLILSFQKLDGIYFQISKAQGSALPPTKCALLQHVQRANYQALCCPSKHGWKLVNELFMPIMTKSSAAPSAILELTKCGCRKGCINNLCYAT
jgi:hypothetical protein